MCSSVKRLVFHVVVVVLVFLFFIFVVFATSPVAAQQSTVRKIWPRDFTSLSDPSVISGETLEKFHISESYSTSSATTFLTVKNSKINNFQLPTNFDNLHVTIQDCELGSIGTSTSANPVWSGSVATLIVERNSFDAALWYSDTITPDFGFVRVVGTLAVTTRGASFVSEATTIIFRNNSFSYLHSDIPSGQSEATNLIDFVGGKHNSSQQQYLQQFSFVDNRVVVSCARYAARIELSSVRLARIALVNVSGNSITWLGVDSLAEADRVKSVCRSRRVGDSDMEAPGHFRFHFRSSRIDNFIVEHNNFTLDAHVPDFHIPQSIYALRLVNVDIEDVENGCDLVSVRFNRVIKEMPIRGYYPAVPRQIVGVTNSGELRYGGEMMLIWIFFTAITRPLKNFKQILVVHNFFNISTTWDAHPLQVKFRSEGRMEARYNSNDFTTSPTPIAAALSGFDLISLSNNTLVSGVFSYYRAFIDVQFDAVISDIKQLIVSDNFISTANEKHFRPYPGILENSTIGYDSLGIRIDSDMPEGRLRLPTQGLQSVDLIALERNHIDISGTALVFGIFITTTMRAVTTLSFSDNVVAAASISPTAPEGSSALSAIRSAILFIDVGEVVFSNNTAVVVSGSVQMAAGLSCVATSFFQRVAKILFVNNSVDITKISGAPGNDYGFSGISIEVDRLSHDVGEILFENNNVSVRVLPDRSVPLPATGSHGIFVTFPRGVIGWRRLGFRDNNIFVSSGNVGTDAFALVVFYTPKPDELTPANQLAIVGGKFPLKPTFAFGVGDIVVERNTVELQLREAAAAESSIAFVSIGINGELVCDSVRISDNNVSILPLAAATSQRLTFLPRAALIDVGCPEAKLKLRIPGSQQLRTVRLHCAADQIMRARRGIFMSDARLTWMRRIVSVRAMLVTPLLDVRRVVVDAAPLLDALALTFQSVYFEVPFASRVAAVALHNVSIETRSACGGSLFDFAALTPLRAGDLDEPSREYLDALTFESFTPPPKTVAGGNLQSPMASRTAIEISNVTVDLTCADDSSAATATGPIVIARFPALPPSFPLDAAIHNSHFFVEQHEQRRTERAVVLATVAPMLEATLLAVPSTDKTPWLRAAVNVSHSSVTTPGAFGDSLFSLEPSDQVTKIGAMSLDSALHCVRWGGEPIASRRARVVRAGSTPTMDVTVQRCGGIRPSFTRSRTDNESSGTRSRSVTRSAPSETRSGTVLAPAPRYGFASDALLAAAKWGGGAAALTGSPGAMLLALRSGVLLRLAMCELHDAPEVRRHVDLRRNHTRAVMERELAFPFPALLPGLTLGARAGGAYRAVVWVDFVLVLVVLVVCLYLGTINKSKWREFVTKRQRDIEDGHVQPSAADAMLRVYFEQDVGEIPFASFAPFDRTVLKAIAFLAPFWSEAAGALLWAQPGGAGDGALAVMPLLFVFAFCLASARYVYSSVRPPADEAPLVGANEGGEQPPPPARGRRGGSARAASGGRGDRRSRPRVGDWEEPLNSAAHSPRSPSSPRSSSSPRERDRPERERQQPQPQRDPAAPQLWVEPSELFVPRGAASDTHRSLHRFLQTPLARFLFVGETAWWRPFLHLPTNSLQPGPGVLTQFAYTFSTYQGPTRHEHKKKARRSSSRGSSDARFTESFSAVTSATTPSHVYDVSRRLLWSPSYIFVALPFLLAQMMIVGAGEADPATCRSGFFVALFVFTWPITLAALFMRPYIVPFRNGVLATVEACTLLGGFIMAGVLGDRDSEPVEATVVAGQFFLTLPAAILPWAMIGVAGFRTVSLKLLQSQIATLRQVRSQLTHELDDVEELMRVTAQEREAEQEASARDRGNAQSFFASLV